MSWDLVLRHCASIKASVEQQRIQGELIASQVAGLEAYAKHCLAIEQAPKATIARPETCKGIQPEDCARLNDEAARHVGGLGGTQIMCAGCGVNPQP